MIRRFGLAAAAAFAIALAACGGQHSGGSVPATAPQVLTQPPANVPVALQVRNYGQGAMSGATYAGTVTNAHLSVQVLVHQQNVEALETYAQEVQNPSSSNFRHFLTPAQIATQFGATQSDYQKVAQYFINNGLQVMGWQQRMLLTVAGTQADMEKAFGTTFGMYSKNGQTFIAPNSMPHFQEELPVDALGGIVRLRTAHTYLVVPPAAAPGLNAGYPPSTVRAAFDYTGAFSVGYDGKDVNLGIIGTGPIDNVDAPGGTHGDYDLDEFLSQTGTSQAAHVTEVPVTESGVANGLTESGCTGSCTFPYSGDFQTPPAVNSSTNPEDGEAQLDTQQAATLAPGSNVLFYLAYNAADCAFSSPPPASSFPTSCPSSAPDYGPEIGLEESDPEIMQAISDDQADVISISYGGGEPQTFTSYSGSSGTPYEGSFSQLEFAELATEGIAVFVSSGDDGTAECYGTSTYLAQTCVSYPAGDPSVTSVGGVTLPVNVYGQATAPWVAWGISTFADGYGALGGSGGGTSATGGVDIPAPPWQVSALSASSREQPDVAMDGDPSTGVSWYCHDGPLVPCSGLTVIGGTSVAAPQMAAMWADVLSACAQHPGTGMCPTTTTGPDSHYRLGNAAPYLYAIYSCKSTPCSAFESLTPALAYNSVFYDIIYGDNQMANPTDAPATPIPGASAGPGYDLTTGVGVPYAGHLIQAITGIEVP